MIRRKQKGINLESVSQVVSREDLLRIRMESALVYINDDLLDYIVSLCEATRDHPHILQGASPRASLALSSLAKATAWIQGHSFHIH